MGNRSHPYDVSLEDFGFIRLDLIEDFIQDDGVIDEKEQGLLIQFETAVARINRGRTIERAADVLMKQDPGNLSRFTRQRIKEAGLHIDPLDAA